MFGDIIQLKQGERHRLLGTESWGIIAEIWRHTDAANPSNEDDIVRVQDDFGRYKILIPQITQISLNKTTAFCVRNLLNQRANFISIPAFSILL